MTLKINHPIHTLSLPLQTNHSAILYLNKIQQPGMARQCMQGLPYGVVRDLTFYLKAKTCITK